MKIITLVVIPVVVLAVGLGIFLAVSNDSGDNSDETQPPITDTTEPEDSDTEPTIPNIPDIEPDDTGDNDQKPANPGDVTIDILDGEESTERNDDPAVDGEVVIIPGVKGENE
jgi:hypothetical protein